MSIWMKGLERVESNGIDKSAGRVRDTELLHERDVEFAGSGMSGQDQFLLYTAPDGAVKVEVFYQDETV